MKITLIVLFSLFTTACVQTASNKPLLGLESGGESIAVVNVYPNDITYYGVGSTIFQNKLVKRTLPDINIPDYIGLKIYNILSKVKGIEVKPIEISQRDKSQLTWNEDENTPAYEKKIQAIPSIVDKLKTQQINKLLIIAPSSIIIPNSNLFTWGAGLWYFFTGRVEPYSAINLYFIDTNTNELVGKHELKSHGELTKLKNDLPDSLIQQIKKDAAKKDFESNDGNTKFVESVDYRIAVECANLERIDEYSNFNQKAISQSVIQSIDHSVSKLESIYFGTPVKKLKNWRQTWSLSTPYSCEI